MLKAALKEKLNAFIKNQENAEMAERTIKKYRHDILELIDFVDVEGELTKKDIMDFKKHLIEKGYAESSVNSYIASVNKYLDYLKLKKLKIKSVRVQLDMDLDNVVTLEDCKRLVKYSAPDTALMIRIFAGTGIRAGELKYFTVENLGKKIKVTNKGKTRNIPIPRELLHDLKEYCRKNRITSGPIFPGKKDPNKTLNESTVFRRMKKSAGRAKVSLEKVHPHNLRHFFAIEYLKAGGNEFELADILGHEDLDTTRIYARSSSADRRDRMDRMRFK